MAFSIRTRLTSWYVALLFVSLLAFGSAFSYSLFRIFVYRIDSQISSVANMMAHTVIRPSGQLFLPRDFDIVLERFFGIRTGGNYIQILDPSGAIVARSSNLDNFSLEVKRETYQKALSGETTYEAVRSVGRFPVRVVTVPIRIPHLGLVAIVQVGSSLEGLDEIFHSLAYIFAIGMAASLVIASLVGSFLARKALKPVAEITDVARRIGAENLNERLNIAVPKDELGRLASTMNEMIERLERAFSQIKQFTADASHELKTPLTVMKGEMEVALRSKDPAYMRESIESALEEIDRMSHIVRNLLDLARIEAERVMAEPVALDVVVTERFEHLKRFALDRGVSMAIIRNTPVSVVGDQVRIGQLVFNLLDNAVKYTPRGGRVEVMLDADGAFAVFSVRDSGIGISEEDLPYVFDRFYRVDKARTRDAGGAGLGLSICKEIAASLGGAIEAKSEAGLGSTFTVRVPAVQRESYAAQADA